MNKKELIEKIEEYIRELDNLQHDEINNILDDIAWKHNKKIYVTKYNYFLAGAEWAFETTNKTITDFLNK